jgi:16S rRNA pseudouridine516 synthase
MRLDRLVSKFLELGSRNARERLASRAVTVNGVTESDGSRLIGCIDRVELGNTVLQSRTPHYIALHKPSGYVSATTDPEHPTVIDLIDAPWADELHLAGRLDRFTTGLVILTNDSHFSEALTLPEQKVPKTYFVDTDVTISIGAVAAIRSGIRLEKENVTTAPASIELFSERSCRLTIYEGKHHQVKRMFAKFDTKVTRLHRESVGSVALESLKPGQWRELTTREMDRWRP